ncbi:MAG: ferritin-like domain-containing protein [Rhodospirillales bacterium]|jgi:hypothetical protein|nr:ferritin-like domain-containing protein [Rhodospirillales bacterium]
MGTWTLDDIPWTCFRRECVEPDLLSVIKAAALVERNADDYVRYLCDVFAGDADFCRAAVRWGEEETQHGEALGRWARLADPEFDFEGRFRDFAAAYRLPMDAAVSVRGSRVGELIARCVVESGTSSLYSALRDGVAEPVLKAICHQIAGDEYRHYKLFYEAMQRYGDREPPPALTRLHVAFGRFLEIEDDELALAYHCANASGEPYDRKTAGERYLRRIARYYQRHHIRRAVGMMTKAAGYDPQGPLAGVASAVIWTYTCWKARLPLAA